jgi:hypothetical protein
VRATRVPLVAVALAAAGCGGPDAAPRSDGTGVAGGVKEEIVVAGVVERPTTARRAVPATDDTPPLAVMVLRNGARSISSTNPVREDDDPPLELTGPELDLTVLIHDAEGTGRVRASLTYEQHCPGRPEPTRRTHHFPPSEIATVKLPPGAEAPVERRRHATVRLERGGAGCVVRGRAWADATNASGLESFSDQIGFVLRG